MLMTPHQAVWCSDVTHPAWRGERGAAARGGHDEYPPDVIPQGSETHMYVINNTRDLRLKMTTGCSHEPWDGGSVGLVLLQ